MTTDFSALCAELTATLAERIDDKGDAGSYYVHAAHLLIRARAALADEPAAPAPPADGEVAELVAWLQEEADIYDCIGCEDSAVKCNRAAELLQRQVLVPVSANERLPGPGDCDAEHYCWRWNTIGGLWARQPLTRSWYEFEGHWLPAHALPVPEVGE